MSKIDCGQLARVSAEGVELRGQVQLGVRLDGSLTIKKHARAGSSDEHPDYSLEYTPTGGRPRPIGAGWLKTSERAGEFITMTLDDPDWPGPLNLSCFPRNDDQWIVTWSRPRGARVQDAI